MSSAPSCHSLLILILHLWYPLWFLSLLHLHPMILPSLSLFPLIHYFLHVYTPKDHITWERTSQKSGGELLQVSALHYLARDRVSKGFRTVASARALHQPTSCGSKYFYNQCPQVRNLIGTERSLIEVSIGLRRKQAKSNSIDGFRNTEVFLIDLDFGL